MILPVEQLQGDTRDNPVDGFRGVEEMVRVAALQFQPLRQLLLRNQLVRRRELEPSTSSQEFHTT